jgi:hypothetical protein
MRWPFVRAKRQSSSQRRFFRPELMQLEDREVLSTTPGLSVALDSVNGSGGFQSTLPALVNSILAFENSVQTFLSSFTTQLNSLSQELHLLQSDNYLLLQAIQQLEHSPPPSQPGPPPTSPPSYLSAFAGTYTASQVPAITHGDIPSTTSQNVSFTLNADGSGVLTVSPFDGNALTLHFNAGSITYKNGTIGFTYPSGLTSYVQFSFTPGSNHQLTGNIYAHGDWGLNASYVVIAFDNITLS